MQICFGLSIWRCFEDNINAQIVQHVASIYIEKIQNNISFNRYCIFSSLAKWVLSKHEYWTWNRWIWPKYSTSVQPLYHTHTRAHTVYFWNTSSSDAKDSTEQKGNSQCWSPTNPVSTVNKEYTNWRSQSFSLRLIGSAMFGATFNLATRVRLPQVLEHWEMIVFKLII